MPRGYTHAIARLVALALTLVCQTVLAQETPPPIKLGIIGLDTIHAVAFTEIINDPEATGSLVDIKVVAGYPGGSPDVPKSWDLVKGYTEKLRGMGLEIVDSIDQNCYPRSTRCCLESLDGRPHLEQARSVIEAGKPIFVDKPLAASLGRRGGDLSAGARSVAYPVSLLRPCDIAPGSSACATTREVGKGDRMLGL